MQTITHFTIEFTKTMNITTLQHLMKNSPEIIQGLKIFLLIAQLLNCIHRDQGHINEIDDSSRPSQKRFILKFHKLIQGNFSLRLQKHILSLVGYFSVPKRNLSKTSQELWMLSLSLFIQGSLWMRRLVFSIARNVISVSQATNL